MNERILPKSQFQEEIINIVVGAMDVLTPEQQDLLMSVFTASTQLSRPFMRDIYLENLEKLEDETARIQRKTPEGHQAYLYDWVVRQRQRLN